MVGSSYRKSSRSRVQRFNGSRFTENPPAIGRAGVNPEPVNAYQKEHTRQTSIRQNYVPVYTLVSISVKR